MQKKTNQKESTKIILEYLEKFKETPSKAIARKIYNDFIGFFQTEEHVYSRVRYYRGQCGTEGRNKISNKQFLQPLKANYMKTELNLPESHTKSRGTFTFPTGCKRLGVFGDVHIPFHDNIALEAMFNKFEEEIWIIFPWENWWMTNPDGDLY